MKLRFLFMMLATYVSVSAQEDEAGKLPNYTPPSPEAAAITKFADLQADEFSGKVSYNLPLYQYKAGKLTLPISLNYGGAGVRVNDLPTWVGINFNLSAGGVVTRAVKDKPDEMATFRVVWNDTTLGLYENDPVDGTPEADYLQDLVFSSQYDTEVDIFQYAFAGYSGSFFFDADWNPRILKKDSEIKIEAIGNFAADHVLRFTTPDGVSYEFGGADAIETTRRIYDSGPSVSFGPSEGISAMYLTKITHPVFGIINFEYITTPTEISLITQRIQKMKKIFQSSGGEDLICGSDDDGCKACSNAPDMFDRFISTQVATKILGARYLHRIYSPHTDEEIIFNSVSMDNANIKRRLISIDIDKHPDTPFIDNTIDFSYSGIETTSNPGYSDVSKRFFLTRVAFDKDSEDADNTQDGKRNQVFEFKYKSPGSLPARFDFDQDFAGYYNGKNNSKAVPKEFFRFDPTDSYNLADRNPDFDLAECGTLTDIYYPTGGRTHFDYQPKKGKKRLYNHRNIYAYRYMTQYNEVDLLTAQYPPFSTGGPPEVLAVDYDQTVQINVKLVAHSTVTYPQRDFATLTITNLTLSQTTTHLIALPSPGGPVGPNSTVEVSRSIGYDFEVGYQYRVTINIHNDNMTTTPHPIEAFVNFAYMYGYEEVDDVGVYLKRQTDYSAANQPENIKRYYYGPISHLAPSLEELPLVEENRYTRIDYELYNYICAPSDCCQTTTDPGPIEHFGLYGILSSELVDSSSNPNSDVFPLVTISYGGDNFENGGIEKEFTYFPNYGDILLETVPNFPLYFSYRLMLSEHMGMDVNIPQPRNGMLLSEKVYRNNDSVLAKISETHNTYTYQTLSRAINVVAKQIFTPLSFTSPVFIGNMASNYAVNYYLQEAMTSELASRQNTTYIDPVPLAVTDESSYRKIIAVEDYEYASFTGQPTKITKNTSDTGVTVETRNYYVDAALANVLDNPAIPNSSNYAAMQERNIVSAPIESRVYKSSELLSRQRTLYSQVMTSQGQAYVPKFIQTAKAGETLEDRVEIMSYDTKGNPLQVRQPGGAIVRYQYNARNQVVLKIENFPTGGSAPSSNYAADTQGTETPDCDAQQAYPNAMVTRYYYKSNGELWRITDPKCQNTTFKYNSLHQLTEIRDHQNNITKTFDLNFDRY